MKESDRIELPKRRRGNYFNSAVNATPYQVNRNQAGHCHITMKQPTRNLFDLIPITTIASETASDSRVILLKPKFRHRLLVKYLLPRLKAPYFKITLDRYGSFVWQQCNGSFTVQQIADLFQKNFPEDAAQAAERVAMFLQHLQRLHAVEFRSSQIQSLTNNSSPN